MIAPTVPGWLDDAFAWMLRATWQASALALLAIGVQWAVGRRLSSRARCLLWAVVIARLLLPPLPAGRWSLFPPTSPAPVWVARADSTGVAPVSIGLKDSGETPVLPIGAAGGSEPRGIDPQRVAALKEALAAMVAADAAPATDALPAPAIAPPPADPPVAWPRLRAALAWCWFVGLLFLSLRVLIASIRLHLHVRRLRPLNDPYVVQLVASCAAEIGLRRPPPVLAAGEGAGPALAGWLRPRLLLPWSVVDAFTAAELRLIVLHELGHVRRRDVPVNWLLAALGALHWFNPVLRLSLRRMRADRELACDEAAITAARADERRAYGHTLLRLAAMLADRTGGSLPRLAAGAVGILEDRQQLHRRIVMISRFNPTSRSWPALVAGGLLWLAAFTLTDAAEPTAPRVAPPPDAPAPPAAPAAAAATAAAPVGLPGGAPVYAEAADGPAVPTAPAAGAGSAPAPLPAAVDQRLKLFDVKLAAKQAMLEEATVRLKRDRQLYDNGAVPEAEVERDETLVAQARAEMAELQFEADQFKRSLKERPRMATVGGLGGGIAPGPAVGMPGAPGGLMGGFGPANIAPAPPETGDVQDADAQRLDQQTTDKLRKPMKLALSAAVPLAKAIEPIRQATGVDIVIDRQALNPDLVVGDLVIDQPAPAAQILAWVLRNAGGDMIGYAIDHGAVLISTRQQLDRLIVTRAYDVSDLVRQEGNLPELITVIVAPNSWRNTGGSIGAIQQFGQKLLITQTQPNHAQVEKLLSLLRGKAAAGAGLTPAVAPRNSAPSAPPRDGGRAQELDALEAQVAVLSRIRDQAAQDVVRLGNKQRELESHRDRIKELDADLHSLERDRDAVKDTGDANVPQKLEVLYKRINELKTLKASERESLNKIGAEYGTDDLSVFYQSRVNALSQIDAKLNDAKLQLALRPTRPDPAGGIDAMTPDQIAMVDSNMARKIEALSSAGATLEKLKQTYGASHPKVQEATRAFEAARRDAEEYVKQFKDQHKKLMDFGAAVSPAGTYPVAVLGAPLPPATQPAPPAAADPFGSFFTAARDRAALEEAMSHMKQLLLAVHMYANEHDNQLPAKFPDDLKPYLDGDPAALIADPRLPDKKLGFVWVGPSSGKLTALNNTSEVPVLTEDKQTWDDGMAVGFADGHVAVFRSREEFLKQYHLTPRPTEAPAAARP